MDKYFEGLKGMAITVCDKDGNILDMNQCSADANSHGQKIIGNNLFDCHPPRAAAILKDLLENEKLNAYTIEKNGKKKRGFRRTNRVLAAHPLRDAPLRAAAQDGIAQHGASTMVDY